MGLFKEKEHCLRTILLTITISACISIVVFIFLEITGREKNLKNEISNGNSFHSEKLTNEKCIHVCDSRNCIKQADMLLRSMNPSIDPCENFEKFLCSSFKEKSGPDESMSTAFDMSARLRNMLKNLIENIEAEPGSASGKMKIVYDSCMNKGSDLHGVDNFRQILNDVEIFNWPHLAPNFTFLDAGLPSLLGILRSYGEISFFGFSIEPATEIPAEMNEKYVRVSFVSHLVNMTSFIQRDAAADILSFFEIDSDGIETILNDHELVKTFLLSFFDEGEQYYNNCENCTNPHIDCSSPGDEGWAYICEIMHVYLDRTELKQYVSKNEIVTLSYNEFYAKNLIPRLKTLSDRSVANFFAMNLLWQHLDEVNFFFRRKKQKYFQYFKTDEKPRKPVNNTWEYCVAWISENMKSVLENEFLKSYFTRSYVDEVHDIHENYISTVAEMIDQQNWIPYESKMFMKNHIKNLQCSMEFIQQNLPNDTYYNDFFKAFKPTTKSFFHNVLKRMQNLLNVYSRPDIEIIERSVEPEFKTDAATDKIKDIVLKYGLFVPPVYYPGYEKFMNQILFATIVVHEIGHNLVYMLDEMAEFSNQTREVYIKKKHCVEKQFSKFKFKILDENLNGTRYIEENLSDCLASTVIDKMIKELRSSEEVFLLPGLPYSPEQLLLMSSKQVFCSKIDRKAEETFKTNDKHAPPEYRIIGTAQNSKEYSEAFCCPEGSYMNPKEKCIFLDTDQ